MSDHDLNGFAGRRQVLRAMPALMWAYTAGAWLPLTAHATLDTAAIERVAHEADLHSVLVWKSGHMLIELYRRSKDKPVGDLFERTVDFGPDVLHDMRSISKSVLALLVGQAVGRGEMHIDTPVLEFYPALADLRRDGRERITLAHLLHMASGLAWSETPSTYGTNANDETRLWWDGNPARYILDRPMVAPPGTTWNYNGGHTVLLADVLEQRSGRKLIDLARTELFSPLGITSWEWRSGQHGMPLAYAGLRLTPRDLLRLGQLMLAKGAWQGRDVVPAAWVEATLQPRISTGSGPLRYGHHWWGGQLQRDGRSMVWIAGFGNGGQRLYIVPEMDLTVVFTAGAYNSVQIGRTENALIQQIIAGF